MRVRIRFWLGTVMGINSGVHSIRWDGGGWSYLYLYLNEFTVVE